METISIEMENDQDSKSGGDDINRCNKMKVIILEKNKSRIANFGLLKCEKYENCA